MGNESTSAVRLKKQADQARTARLRVQAAPQLLACVERVKAFQTQRLAQTHADLLQSARYGQAARFFLDDLYGASDVSRRDEELVRVIPVLARFLPEPALAVLADATELDSLSEQLDAAVAVYANSNEPLNFDAYRVAYLRVHQDNPSLREHQMNLVVGVGQVLDGLVRKPLLGGLLKSMGPVAMASGFQTMHDFLSRGFTAFKQMGGAREFMQQIESRERENHERLIKTV
jgi:hypothetical protein